MTRKRCQGILVFLRIRRHLLLIFNILNLAILDPSITSISTFPLLRSVRLIEIAEFLERLDPLIILLIYIGIFVKMTAFYLGAVLALQPDQSQP